MKLEKSIIALLLPLLALIALGSAHALILSGPSLNASLLYYQPVPAAPGTLLDVFVQVNNDGETAQNVNVRFVDNGPFTIDDETDRVKSIQSIPGQQSFLIKYKVRVSQDAAPGTSYIKIEYASGNGQPQSTLLPIDIFSTTISLNMENIALNPQYMVPGGVGNISFQLHNTAPIKITEGTVTLDLSNLDIAPVGGTNQQHFTNMQPGDLEQFQFQLAPSPNIAPGVYKIPIMLNFSDQQGRGYQRTEFVGVRIGAVPDVSVTVDSSKITAEAKTGDIIIRATNKGLGEVKFVDVTVGKSDTYDLVSNSNEQYIGNIDSDDYKTASITLTAKADVVQIPVTITYMDALNTPYTKTEVLTLQVRSSKTGGSSGYIIVGVIIVLAVAAYLIFRRRKGR